MKFFLYRLAISAALLTTLALAEDHWVGTWAASPQAPRAAVPPAQAQIPQINGGPVTIGQTQTGQTIQAGITVTTGVIGGASAPVASQLPPQSPPANTFNNHTIRMVVRSTIGGRRARVHFSNAHGTAPLTLGAAHIALRSEGSGILTGSGRALTFNGKPSAWIPVGADVVSDPLDFNVPSNGDLTVTVYVPRDTGAASQHAIGLHTTYISKPGNFVADAALTDATTSQSWYWLSAIEVLAPLETSAIVAFGDSITDGTRSTPDTDNSWPSQFARRLIAAGTSNIAVLNQGISGNRVLRDGTGANAQARFDRDVLAMNGVKWIVLLEGINDIGQGNRAGLPDTERVTADDVIFGVKQLIEKAHTHDIKTVGGTLTAIEGSAYYNESAESARQAYNQWVRTAGAFDAIVDFDAATRDAANPKKFRADFDSGDHLHPNDTGYKAMAAALDLSVFGVKPQ